MEIDSSKTGATSSTDLSDLPACGFDYSCGSLRHIKLKLRVEGSIEMLLIKEIIERKTAKDTKAYGLEKQDRTSRPKRRSLESRGYSL